MKRMNTPVYGMLTITGWHGATSQQVLIVGGSKSRTCIQAITRTRLAGRGKWLEPGRETLVPSGAVCVSATMPPTPDVVEQARMNHARYGTLPKHEQRALVEIEAEIKRQGVADLTRESTRVGSNGNPPVKTSKAVVYALLSRRMIEVEWNQGKLRRGVTVSLTKVGIAALDRIFDRKPRDESQAERQARPCGDGLYA